MSNSAAPLQQHKQPSRKGKRAWRKNVDISEVQKGLEDLRDEIIQGGPVAEKSSGEIFALDARGSEAIQKAYNRTHKPLKVDEILGQRSAVPAIDSRKRSGSSSRTTDGIVEPGAKRQKKNWVTSKELQRVKQSLRETSKLSTDKLADAESLTFDLWANNTAPASEVADQSEYVPKPKQKTAPSTLRRPPIAMTANGKAVPAIQNPKAGTSYNPSFPEWDDLLTQEGQKEIEAETERLREDTFQEERAARVAAAAASANDDAGGRTDEESAWEGFESENESPETVLKQKRPERKTPAQRNKIKRRKEAERQAAHELKMVDKRKQAADLEAAAKKKKKKSSLAPRPDDTAVASSLANIDEAESDESGDDTRLRRRKLGNVAIPPKPLEVVLPDELQESLRRLKPEGNLMNDRFRNLLVNGKLEARKPITQPKKVRRTYTEKWSYKDFKVGV